MSTDGLRRHRILELSRQVDEAVDQLWATGKLALVLRLLSEDAQRLVDDCFSEPSPELAALTELCRQRSQLGLPGLDRELTPAHLEFLDRLASCRRRCLRRLGSSHGRSTRLRRAALFGLALCVAGVGGYLMLRNTSSAEASSTYSSDYPARHAVDGLKTTEWLLPDGQVGWLELSFARPRDVRALLVRNSVNGNYRDRATNSVKIEAYRRSQAVASARAQLPSPESGKSPVRIPIHARAVTHVRISVESFYGAGGGLAEVDVE